MFLRPCIEDSCVKSNQVSFWCLLSSSSALLLISDEDDDMLSTQLFICAVCSLCVACCCWTHSIQPLITAVNMNMGTQYVNQKLMLCEFTVGNGHYLSNMTSVPQINIIILYHPQQSVMIITRLCLLFEFPWWQLDRKSVV